MSIRIRSEAAASGAALWPSRTWGVRLAAMFVLCTLFLAASRPAFAADELEAYRERFRVGYEKYMARDFAGAIVEWEAIYRELGAERGYRLAFNLARAYDAYGDYTRAAEAYEGYLGEVAKKKDGAPLEPIVVKQAEEAEERLKELAKTRGRVRVRTQGRAIVVQVDSGEPRVSGFTAYVAPGAHTITWNPGTADERKVEIKIAEGALEIVDPPPLAVPPPDPRGERGGAPPPPPRPEPVTTTLRPIPAWALYVGAGATAISVIVPVIYYQHASTLLDRQKGATTNDEKQGRADDYDGARNEAYYSLAVPSTLAALTLGATAYYFLGGREQTITPTMSVTGKSANAGLVGRF